MSSQWGVVVSFAGLAGVGGIGFVGLALAVNVRYLRLGVPTPNSGQSLAAVADSLAEVGDRLKRPSVVMPATWVCTTVFAAGLLAQLWRGELETDGWALVGFAGVLMQNATFMVVEALRFGLVAAARRRDPIAGLWSLTNVLFGLNQVFLTLALLGFTAAGAAVGFIPGWHAGLGYLSAALLFVSSAAAPYNSDDTNRVAVTGLIGWFGWAAWIVVYSVVLLVG